MDQNKIEKIAVNTVREYFEFIEQIVPNIDENDKTLSLDGNLEVFAPLNGETKQNSKRNQLYKIPVQVKGTTKPLKNNKFSVHVDDLKYYSRNGYGLIFFVVFISEQQQKQLLYKELRPMKVHQILSGLKDDAKTITLEFKKLPSDKSQVLSILNTFHINVEKQPKQLLSIGKISDQNNSHLQFFLDNNNGNVMNQIQNTEVDFYLKKSLNGETVSIPYGTGVLKDYYKQIKIKIMNNNGDVQIVQASYSPKSYNVILTFFNQSILNMKFFIKNEIISKFTYNYIGFGTLNQRLKDLDFICSLINEDFFIIAGDDSKISINVINNNLFSHIAPILSKINEIKENLTDFKKFLNSLEISANFNPEDEANKKGMSTLDSLFGFSKNNEYDVKENQRIEIHLDENYYQILVYGHSLINLLSKNIESKLGFFLHTDDKDYIINPYVTITHELYKYPNFKKRQVAESFKKSKYYDKNSVSDYLYFVNELINNYDLSDEVLFLQIAKTILKNLVSFSNNKDLIKINIIQINKRKNGALNFKETSWLLDIIKHNKDVNNTIFASILLDISDTFEKNWNTLNDESKEELHSLSIFHLK